jgi:hypothetical protein
MKISVFQIKAEQTDDWCKRKHYMRRLPFVSYAFGLYLDGNLEGVVTYGSPHGANLFKGIFEDESISEWVIELNRLCIDSKLDNAASILVSRSLKLLPTPKCVISFSDTGYGHIGYVYQATNFLYTGTTIAHNPEYIINGKKTPNRTLSDWGIKSPVRWAKDNNVEMIGPRPKHRYIFFHGTKAEKRRMRRNIQYTILREYPKGQTKRHPAEDRGIEIQKVMFV